MTRRTQDTNKPDLSENQAKSEEHENAQDVQKDGNIDARHQAELGGAFGLDGAAIVALGLLQVRHDAKLPYGFCGVCGFCTQHA